MATWYVDYEGGTDANASAGNGDSFATRRKKIDNLVAAAIAPGDTVRIMASPTPASMGQNAQWTDGPLPASKSINSSTNATPIVMTVTSHGYATGDTVIVNGHTTNTNANGVWTINVLTANTFQLLNADGTNSVGNGVGGTSGTVRKFTNAVVTLSSAVTKNIALCGNQGTKPNWTASANVTCTNKTVDGCKEGQTFQEVQIGSAFTTGLVAYYATDSLDLSGYQQVSLWVRWDTGAAPTAGQYKLSLCTDTAGATTVHDIPIPPLGTTGVWVPIVVNLGVNLSASIRSIALYALADVAGVQAVHLDNIVACKAASSPDSLNLTSLISKDPGDHSYGDGYECWWAIQSINGTRIVLEGHVNSSPGASPQRGYSGTTESVNLYRRETVKTVAAAASSTAVQTTQDAGTSGSPITFSGGWNRTDMSTQTGETWFDGQNGNGYGYTSAQPFCSFDKLNFSRYSIGFKVSHTDAIVGSVAACSTTNSPIDGGSLRLTATTLSAVSCGGPITPGTAAVVQTIGRADSTTSGNGVTLGTASWTGTIKSASNNSNVGAASGTNSYIDTIEKAHGNAASGYATGTGSVCGYVDARLNTSYGVDFGPYHNSVVLGGYTAGNIFRSVNINSTAVYMRNMNLVEASEFTTTTAYYDSRVYSENHDNTAGYTKIFCDGGLIETQTSVTHGSAVRAWKFSPTSTNRSQYYPLNLPIAQVAVAANSAVTVKCWFARASSLLTGRLMCKGGQLSGVASDVYADMTVEGNMDLTFQNTTPVQVAWSSHNLSTGDVIGVFGATNTYFNGTWTVTAVNANTISLNGSVGQGATATGHIAKWQELSISFTPTEAGVVEIEAQFWGSNMYTGFISDATIQQV